MRRSLLLVGSLAFALAACGDSFTAHPDVAAEAAGQELSAERVAEILTTVKGVQVNAEAAQFVAQLWTDYTLFAQAIAGGSFEADSATIADAMWMHIAGMTTEHWFDTLAARRANVTPAKIDSAYAAGSVRVLQHVLIEVQPDANEATRAENRRLADRIRAQAVEAGDLGALALEHTADLATKVDSGFLPPSPRGAFVAPFDSAAWLLEPGEISGVVVTSYGFHVIRRASEAQAKARLEPWLAEQLMGNLPVTYFAELDSVYDVELSGGAVGRAREALHDLNAAGRNNRALLEYRGGEITVSDFARFVRAMTSDPVQGAQNLEQMKQLPDSTMELAVRQLGQRYLFLKTARDSGMTLTPAEWEEVSTMFRNSIDTLKANIGLGQDVLDPNAPEADRRRAAAMRVDQFFDRMVQGQARMQLLPGMLTWTLRQDADARVNPAGVQQAVALAEARLGPLDSTMGAGAAPAPIRPAPGGPPVGGDAP